MTTPVRTLTLLYEPRPVGALAQFCGRQRVELLVVFGSALRDAATARDLDIAVLAPSRIGIEQLQLVSELSAYLHHDIDVANLATAGILARSEARGWGKPLYEQRPGLFAEQQMRALGQRMDTNWLHDLRLELSRVESMTPARLNAQTVVDRLRLITEALDDLASIEEISSARLQEERLTRRVVERCLQLCVDAATAVNAHVAAATIDEVPRDLTKSFDLAARAGVLPVDLAERLRPSAGMRNAIVHTYAEPMPTSISTLVAAAVPLTISGYREYVAAVTRFLRDHENR